MKTIIYNCSEIVTNTGKSCVVGKRMNDLVIYKNSAIYIEDEIIKDIDLEKIIIDKYYENDVIMYDCKNNSVIPGLIDSHTHLVFAGYRYDEFVQRMSGKTYTNIMEKGGGINKSVSCTRDASKEELINNTKKVLKSMLSFGITTVEAKSGYGLDFNTEIKQLEVIKEINSLQDIEIVSTYLGAHSIPFDMEVNKYIQYMNDIVLPYIKEHQLAEFVDVFMEKGVYNQEQSRRILLDAIKQGFKTKIHADELSHSGGAKLASELGCISADHLLYANDNDIMDLARNNVITVLLPMTAFNLKENYVNARKFIDYDCAVALGSDYNPGSCFSENISLVFLLANLYMGMTTAEVLTALTINAASSIDRAETIGSIEIGKQADIVVLDYPTYQFIPYHIGVSCVNTVFKKGKIVYNGKIN